MTIGHVYILRNEAMPGLVKIGMTAREVGKRIHELNTTGVPFDFELVKAVRAPDCAKLEAAVHARLADCRVNNGREFFLCPEDKAVSVLREEHEEMVSSWRNWFMGEDHDDEGDLRSDPSLAYIWANHLGVSPYDVIFALDHFEEGEMRCAVNRFRARRGEPQI